MSVPMREFIYEIGNSGRTIIVVAESKFAAKRKLERMENITPDTPRRLVVEKQKEEVP